MATGGFRLGGWRLRLSSRWFFGSAHDGFVAPGDLRLGVRRFFDLVAGSYRFAAGSFGLAAGDFGFVAGGFGLGDVQPK